MGFITSPKYKLTKTNKHHHSMMNTAGTFVYHHSNVPHSFSTRSGNKTPIPKSNINIASSQPTLSSSSLNTSSNATDIEILTHQNLIQHDNQDDDDDEKYIVAD